MNGNITQNKSVCLVCVPGTVKPSFTGMRSGLCAIIRTLTLARLKKRKHVEQAEQGHDQDKAAAATVA